MTDDAASDQPRPWIATPMDNESQPIDPLLDAVRRVRENADPSRVDVELVTTVLRAVLRELPEHFGPGAHAAYAFWLRNRIEALRTDRQFHQWVLTTSYVHYPDLLICGPP